LCGLMSDDWLMPAAFHKRKSGPRAKSDHMDVRSLSRVLELMPGVTAASHVFRRAAASYGPPELGWDDRDSKLILDHMEGHDSGDVTAQHYNSDPALLKKRAMMKQWIGWLEQQEAAAVAADPTLLDHDAIACRTGLPKAVRRGGMEGRDREVQGRETAVGEGGMTAIPPRIRALLDSSGAKSRSKK
jgi:hypothetical protein